MPLHLPGQNRRQFLQSVGAGLLVCSSTAFAAESSDIEDDLVYLLNDTHIGEKQPADSPVPSHLRLVVEELVQRERKPGAVMINGDLALKDGQPGDYRHLARLLEPLRKANIDLHLTLGNHDHREVFYEILQEERPEAPPVASRHLAIVETRLANFFLLDSLHETMVTPGTLGEEQRKWLAEALDARPDKAAILVTHHNPRLGGEPVHYPGGLTDSQELWKLLTARPQVKAYVHGHIHDRGYFEHKGIAILNLPATSYVADRNTSTTGWTTARLVDDGMILTTHTTDRSHPWNGQATKIAWRR